MYKNEISKNNNIRNITIGTIVLIMYFILTKDFNVCMLLNNVITISMITVFIYINIIRTKFVDQTFMKGFELTYLMLAIIIFFNIIGIAFLFDSIPKIYLIFIITMQVALECCSVEKFLHIRESYLKSSIICISYLALLLILLYIFAINNTFSYEDKSSLIISNVIVSAVISLGTCISTLENIVTNKKKFLADEFKIVVIYMISIILYQVGFIFLSIKCIEAYSIIVFIKCIVFYKFYKYMISKVFDNSLIKINSNIEIATRTKRELNSILKKRNTILNEANIMLQKSQDRNNELIESIYDGVFLFYNDKLQYINKKALGTLNSDNSKVLGMQLDEFIKTYFNITLEDIKKSANYIPFTKMKHTELEVEVFLTYIDEQSEILYIHDISYINENKKIKKALEECLEEEEIKKEFFSNISHELKTPINLIFSALQVNQIYLDENNIEGINRNRKIIRQNCLRLIRTINNFIDANKISEGYMKPDYKVHNIVQLVENLATASNKYIQLIENTLTFDPDEEEIYVNCDKEMITRIILNILSNSVKYGRKGGHINVNISIHKKNSVIIKVKNDGLEIDRETIPYIFDKFTKLNKAFNRLKEGSGLGLFLTKALIELQGGTINLISNNTGNEFIITMPRVVESYDEEILMNELETNPLEEKIDVEFSDIYIE